MMDLETLSTPELTRICQLAGRECERRFDQIARAADPSDKALRDLLTRMAGEAHAQVDQLQEEWSSADDSKAPDVDGFRQMLREAFTSLTKSFGEGWLHRDVALFFAESLEEEASRFYRTLAEHARESRIRTLFHELSRRESGKLRFLREVVLQG